MFASRNKRPLLEKAAGIIWPRIGYKRTVVYVWHRLRRIHASPHTIALGFATGVFLSFNPMLGFHLVMAAAICWLIGGSFIAAAVGTLFYNPIMSPFMMVGNYHIGMLLIGEHMDPFEYVGPKLTFGTFLSNPVQVANDLWPMLAPVFLPLLLGSVILGMLTAIPVYFSTKALVEAQQRRSKLRRTRSTLLPHPR